MFPRIFSVTLKCYLNFHQGTVNVSHAKQLNNLVTPITLSALNSKSNHFTYGGKETTMVSYSEITR